MSQNLDDALRLLQDAGKKIFLEMSAAGTDDQQEAIALMQKGISEVKALIGEYEYGKTEHTSS